MALDHILAVVARERYHDTGCADIGAIIPGRSDGVIILKSAIVAANHYYAAMTEWLGIEPGDHYICLDLEENGNDSNIDVRGVEKTDEESVDMIILHPFTNVIESDQTGLQELDVSGIIKRIVRIALYIDITIHGKVPSRENVDDAFVKSIVDSSADDAIRYARKLSRSW